MILSRDLLTRTDPSYYSSLRLSDVGSFDVTPCNRDSAIIPDHVPSGSI